MINRNVQLLSKKFVIVGYGYWGQKVYNTLKHITSADNIYIVDPYLKEPSTALNLITEDEALNNESIEFALIITPEITHYSLVKKYLLAGKNVFVEKPLCLHEVEAKELKKISKEIKKVLYVDYTFLFDPFVKKIKKITSQKFFGEICHIESFRYSININKPHVTVMDDLAMHDIYLGQYFFDKRIKKVSLNPYYINSKQVNQAIVSYSFGKNKNMICHYSWKHPVAKRALTIIGEKLSLVWEKGDDSLGIYRNQKLIKKINVSISKYPLELSIRKFINSKYNLKKIDQYINDVKILESIDKQTINFI